MKQNNERVREQFKDICHKKKPPKKIGSISLIERVILSAGAMLIFSVSFQFDQMPEGGSQGFLWVYIVRRGIMMRHFATSHLVYATHYFRFCDFL